MTSPTSSNPASPAATPTPDGFFGGFGGVYVPETLDAAIRQMGAKLQ